MTIETSPSETSDTTLADFAGKVRFDGNKLVLHLGGRDIAFRTTLYADDWLCRDENENDDDGINLAMYYCELAQRLSGELPDVFYELGEEDTILLHTMVGGLVDATFDRAECAVELRDSEVWASLLHPLRMQNAEEIDLHGKDTRGLSTSAVRFRPVLAKDLVRSESAGSSPSARVARLYASVTGLPEHQIRRLDLRDFAALEVAYAKVKKSPDIAARVAMRQWVVAKVTAGLT